MSDSKAQDSEFIPTRRSLLVRLKDWDDNESWKTFFETYWKLIYSSGIKSGLSDAEAQDLVQETVTEVARKMRDFKYDPALGSFKGWLLNLTRWRIVDQFRKRRKDSPMHSFASEDGSRTSVIESLPDEQTFNLEMTWEAEWEKNLVDAALHRVKRKVGARQYQLFDLYVMKEWKIKDISKTLNVSADQIYQAKFRVSRVMKEELEHLKTKML